MVETDERPYRRLPAAQVQKIRADIALLGAPDQEVARKAVTRLGRRRGQVVEFLIEALSSDDADVRHRALHALERVGDLRAYQPIEGLVQDAEPDNRWCALVALAELGGTRAIPVLTAVLLDSDADAAEWSGAAEGLAKLGTAAIPSLAQMIDSDDHELRQRASWALRDISDESVIALLSKLLTDPDWVTRWVGVESLSRFGQENAQKYGHRCLALIEPMLSDNAEDVRKVAECEAAELLSAIARQDD